MYLLIIMLIDVIKYYWGYGEMVLFIYCLGMWSGVVIS